ncbi:MAG: hypothetical protein ABSE40_23550 [Candidatus Sulfotelmatobacter sp.]|jgi:hypothetical protein
MRSAFVGTASGSRQQYEQHGGGAADGHGHDSGDHRRRHVDYLPLWDSTSDITISALFQTGTGSTAKVGIRTTTPTVALDVNGSGVMRGLFSLPAVGTATASKGYNSQAIQLTASVLSSASATAVAPHFQWQAEPVGNDTATPSGTLNLLYAAGTATPAETGLKIATTGRITFAAGQTFPGTGTGNGTITGVTAGTDLTGGGTSGAVTLNLDTTKVPQLATANTFSGAQTIRESLNK